MSFYRTGSSGTLTGPAKFDPENECKKLFEGMEGLGTNEDAIVEVVAGHTNEQRQVIKATYKTIYGKELEQELDSELSCSFAKIIQALMKPPEEYIIESINHAISRKTTKIGQILPRSIRLKLGLGTDESAIISLIYPRTNDELYALRKAYKRKYGHDMEKDFAEDWNDDFRFLVVGIINGDRDEYEKISPLKIQEDVQALQGGTKGKGNGEEIFRNIFTQRSYAHLRELFNTYKECNRGEKDIEGLIESTFSEGMQAAYLAMVKLIRNVQEYYADKLNDALRGAGTDDDSLIRIVVSRSEIDLSSIMDIYEGKYNTTLMEDVTGDTSGDYKHVLEKLLTPGQQRDPTTEEVTASDAGEGEESAPPEEEEEEVEGKATTAEAVVMEAPTEKEIQAEAEEADEAANQEEEAKDENAENGEVEEVKEEEGQEEAKVAKEDEEGEAEVTNEEGGEDKTENIREEGVEVDAMDGKEDEDDSKEEGEQGEAIQEEPKEECAEAAAINGEGKEMVEEKKVDEAIAA